MRYKEYGRTGKRVSVLGFGGMRFDPENEDLAVRTIHRAVELGVNYFDTAPGYCENRSEAFIGKALASLSAADRSRIFVSTKSHHGTDPDAASVRRRIEGQLKILKKEKIEFFNMWCLMDYAQFRMITAPGGPYEGAVKAREEGLVEHISCSTHASGEDIAKMAAADLFEGYTLGYNLINREFREEGISAAASAGRAVITMNPLGGGMLTRSEDKLGGLREHESDSVIAAALRFNLAHPHVTVVLAGMKNPQEVEVNVRAADSISGPDLITLERLKIKFAALGESFCTGCGYCLSACPEGIQIPIYANLWDRVRMGLPDDVRRVVGIYLEDEDRWFKGKRASDCTDCGACEAVCTQKLPLREYLKKISEFLHE